MNDAARLALRKGLLEARHEDARPPASCKKFSHGELSHGTTLLVPFGKQTTGPSPAEVGGKRNGTQARLPVRRPPGMAAAFAAGDTARQPATSAAGDSRLKMKRHPGPVLKRPANGHRTGCESCCRHRQGLTGKPGGGTRLALGWRLPPNGLGGFRRGRRNSRFPHDRSRCGLHLRRRGGSRRGRWLLADPSSLLCRNDARPAGGAQTVLPSCGRPHRLRRRGRRFFRCAQDRRQPPLQGVNLLADRQSLLKLRHRETAEYAHSGCHLSGPPATVKRFPGTASACRQPVAHLLPSITAA